jgi:hypothetical protein
VLTPELCKETGLTFERRCALFVARGAGQPGAWFDHKHTFLCFLPGHQEVHPSARWMWQDDGMVLYHDMHQRSGRLYWTLPEVYAALVSGKVRPLKRASKKTWRLRLAVDAGLVQPYPVAMPPLPPDAPPLERRLYDGFRLLLACKWVHKAEAPTMFGRAFAAGWCGIPEGSFWLAMQGLLRRKILVRAGYEEGRPVYLPGVP